MPTIGATRVSFMVRLAAEVSARKPNNRGPKSQRQRDCSCASQRFCPKRCEGRSWTHHNSSHQLSRADESICVHVDPFRDSLPRRWAPIPALRVMEEVRIGACVIVAGFNSGDWGSSLQKQSGSFDHPFDYAKIVRNCPLIIQRIVPIRVGRDLASQLKIASDAANADAQTRKTGEVCCSTSGAKEEFASSHAKQNISTFVYVEYPNCGHFQQSNYPVELWDVLCQHLPLSHPRGFIDQ